MLRAVMVVLIAVVITPWPLNAARAADVHAWFVDSLVKVFPADAPGAHRLASAEYWGARNQHVSVQLALRSGKAFQGITVQVKPLFEKGATESRAIEVHHVGYVVAGSHTPDSPPDELVGVAPGWYPDVLEEFPFDLKPDWTVPIWITIHIPEEAHPGVYRGAIQVRAKGKLIARNRFVLHVVAARVPQARTLHVTNWFSLNDDVSRQFYGVPMFSPAWWKLLANVGRVLADYRQNVALTPLMTLIQPRIDDGRLSYDYANFDRWVETLQQAGVIGTIEGSHLTTRAQGAYQGSLMVPILEITNNAVQQITVPAGDPRVVPFLTSFLSQLASHLKEKGWTHSYVQHISDEPHGPEMPFYVKFAAIVHQSMPGVRTIDAVDLAHITEDLRKSCDIWVPILGSFDGSLNLIRQHVQEGHAVWYYTCISPEGRYLNRFLDFPLVKTRLLPWLDFRYGLTGFLHWGGNDWTPKPMLDTQPVINDNQTLLPPGDAFIVYPDRAHLSVKASIRLEALRAGIEDYEMLRILQSRNPAEAREISHSAISSFTGYVRDARQFRRIERQLLRALSEK
ncbi:MAG TPA: glycoside hydrolase domain-containing protein [Terriglobia bacterium]|nr:glycoside hydrolase domain-containing protein [Terriglobia bacterium]